jgi:DnaJ-class molecular chaperone
MTTSRQDDLRELGLSEAEVEADSRNITRRYRELARERHPDKNRGSKEAFQQLVNAYERLLVTAVSSSHRSHHQNERTTGDTAAPPSRRQEADGRPDFDFLHYHFFRRAQEAQG